MPESPTPDDIKFLFYQYGMSQNEAGLILGLSKSTIEKWCQGLNVMPPLMWIGAKHYLSANYVLANTD